MKKIAIFTSGEGKSADRLVSHFNEGDRIRVDLVVTDNGDSRLVEKMIQSGVNAVYLPRATWESGVENVLSLLSTGEIELIALDELQGELPEEIANKYSGRIIALASPDDAPQEVAVALGEESKPECGNAVPEADPSAAPQIPEIPKSADEEWAETLKIKFDPQTVAQTPPPIPGVASPRFNGQYAPMPNARYQSSPTEPMPSTYLIWSILCTVFCCFIPGIVAIIFSSQVSSKYYVGDIEGARRASRNAEVWIIVSFVLGVLSATLYLPIMLFAS